MTSTPKSSIQMLNIHPSKTKNPCQLTIVTGRVMCMAIESLKKKFIQKDICKHRQCREDFTLHPACPGSHGQMPGCIDPKSRKKNTSVEMCTVSAMYKFDVRCSETLNFQSENRNMSKFPSSALLLPMAHVTGTLATSGGQRLPGHTRSGSRTTGPATNTCLILKNHPLPGLCSLQPRERIYRVYYQLSPRSMRQGC